MTDIALVSNTPNIQVVAQIAEGMKKITRSLRLEREGVEVCQRDLVESAHSVKDRMKAEMQPINEEETISAISWIVGHFDTSNAEQAANRIQTCIAEIVGGGFSRIAVVNAAREIVKTHKWFPAVNEVVQEVEKQQKIAEAQSTLITALTKREPKQLN